MAIEENDREDLLRDARMMPVRGQTLLDGQTVVIGFRSNGQLSLYCGADPVFQFNAANQLRRVFFAGERYAAEDGRLIMLARKTLGGKVTFDRQAVTEDTTAQIQTSFAKWFQLACTVPAGAWRSAEADGDFTKRFNNWQKNFDGRLVIAKSPNA